MKTKELLNLLDYSIGESLGKDFLLLTFPSLKELLGHICGLFSGLFPSFGLPLGVEKSITRVETDKIKDSNG
jgi:hypothetical protein